MNHKVYRTASYPVSYRWVHKSATLVFLITGGVFVLQKRRVILQNEVSN